jgi:hypothetical protein
MMEDLIWQYIDNTCTDEEKERVIKLLQTDAAFKKSYEAMVDLEDQLLNVAQIPMRDDFKKQLIDVVSNKISEKKTLANIHVLPLHWIVGLSFVAVASIIYALSMSESTSSGLSFIPALDEKIISMLGWVTTSFIMLTLLDLLLKKIHVIKRLSGFSL